MISPTSRHRQYWQSKNNTVNSWVNHKTVNNIASLKNANHGREVRRLQIYQLYKQCPCQHYLKKTISTHFVRNCVLFLIFITYMTKIITNHCRSSLPVPRRSCTVEIWSWSGMGRGIFFRFPRLLFLAGIITEIIITESMIIILHKFMLRI